MSNKKVILYGVGVGPGAPDLMTLRAVNVLKSVDVIAIPRSNEYASGVAWGIAKPIIGEVEGQERLFLTFPMTKEPKTLRPAWTFAFSEIKRRLDSGKSVAFITEGDPLVYGSFIYLLAEAKGHWSDVELKIVPAVSSITAVPMAIQTPLAEGQERIAIVPATYGVEDLKQIVLTFDTVLLMKVKSIMPQIIEVIQSLDLMDNAFYVSKATTSEEYILRDLHQVNTERCEYFSMVVISRRQRAGVLREDESNTKVIVTDDKVSKGVA